MFPEINLVLVRAAAAGVLVGTFIGVGYLLVRERHRRRAEYGRKVDDRPTCRWSSTDPMNAAIVRVGKTRR